MAGASVTQATANLQLQLTEDEERTSLDKLLQLRDAVRSGQHPKFRPKGVSATTTDNYSSNPNGNAKLNQQNAAVNAKQNGNAPAAPIPSNTIDTTARPIPVFTGSSKSEQNGGRAVITVAGKDVAPNATREQRDGGGRGRQQLEQRMPQQQQQQQQQPQQSQLQNQPQWDHNQPWMMHPGQTQMQPSPEDMNAFAQHLPMLPVPLPPPPGFEVPPGFPFSLALAGQALPGQSLPQLIPLTNQGQQQPEPMAVDKPQVIENRKPEKQEREQAAQTHKQQQQQTRQNESHQIIQHPAAPSVSTDLQAGMKKAQEYAARLPPKPTNVQKQNSQPQAKQSQEKNRRNSVGGQAGSPMAPSFPANVDRLEEEKQAFQGRNQRDHRQYGDKRGGEPLRKTAMNNNHKQEDRRERDRDIQRDRQERERERDRDQWQGRDNRNSSFKKRRSLTPQYDEGVPGQASGFATASRPIEVPSNARAYDNKNIEIDEREGATIESRKRANSKEVPKLPPPAERRPSSPQPPPVKREPAPSSPVVTIPRNSPTLEPLSPGRAARYGIPPQDRYAKQPGYFRYREPYPPPPHVMGYARSPYEAEYGYAPHPREPRPMSPRRVYLPEQRGYAQEYVYQDPYQDPYYQYPGRRPGSPPPRGIQPRYRYEDEDPQKAPRGRSPSPRAPGRMPVSRPRRLSRSLSPSRDRPAPRASAPPAEVAEEPRSDRALVRASDAPYYAEYPPYHRPMIPYDAYGDPYGRPAPVIIRERPVYVTRVVYVDSNDPEGRPYRPRSPGYAPPHAAPPLPPPPAHAQHAPPPLPPQAHPPPQMRRYVEDPDIVMSDRIYRERDYDYGPAAYDRGYGREYAREYAPPQHHHAPPPPPQPQARDAYAREYPMQPPLVREDERERVYREREYPGGGGNPPMPAPRDVEDGRLPYGREGRGGMSQMPGGPRYA